MGAHPHAQMLYRQQQNMQAARTKQYSYAQGVRRGMSAEEIARLRALHTGQAAPLHQHQQATVFGQERQLNHNMNMMGNGSQVGTVQSKFGSQFGRGRGAGDLLSNAGSVAGTATKRGRSQSAAKEIKVEFADIDEILEQCTVAPPGQKKAREEQKLGTSAVNEQKPPTASRSGSPASKHVRYNHSNGPARSSDIAMRTMIVKAAIKRLGQENGAPLEKLE